ncbi:MAG: isochorismate synthase [Chlamydiales bacterium]|nr:isochorismate synthase [Chlamydiales bacterium]
MDLLERLQEITEYPKIYWKERSSSLAFGGAGKGGSSPVSYGWRHSSSQQVWSDFPTTTHITPRLSFETNSKSDLCFLEKPRIKQCYLLPGYNHWSMLVEKALKAIEENQFKKCVLARECKFELERPINPWSLVAALEKRTENAYVICIQPTSRSAFISITPEMLFSRKDQLLTIEALAGTQTLHQSTSFPLSHPKHTQEFSLVEQSIGEALGSAGLGPFTFCTPSIRTTSGGLQHLYSRLETQPPPNMEDEMLLEILHPTAALSGFPKEPARQFLSDHEPFDRGLYGAPLGRITENTSTWAVGIRSCLLFDSTATLYSGAGIVSGSDPLTEWEELDHKIALFKEIFLS